MVNEGYLINTYATQADKDLKDMILKTHSQHAKKEEYSLDEYVQFFAEHPNANPNAIVRGRVKDMPRSTADATMLQLAVAGYLHKLADFLVSKGADPNLVVDGCRCVRNIKSGEWSLVLGATKASPDSQ